MFGRLSIIRIKSILIFVFFHQRLKHGVQHRINSPFFYLHISDKLVAQSLLVICGWCMCLCYVLLFTTVCLALFFGPFGLFVLL